MTGGSRGRIPITVYPRCLHGCEDTYTRTVSTNTDLRHSVFDTGDVTVDPEHVSVTKFTGGREWTVITTGHSQTPPLGGFCHAHGT